MAGKSIEMSLIKDLLRMHKSGSGHKKIARSLDISKTTVKSYLDRLTGSGMEIDMLLEMDDLLLEGQFHAGNPSYKDKRYVYLESRLEQYISELSRKDVTRYQLWQDYRQECAHAGYAGYAPTQFNHHLNQLLLTRMSSPSTVLAHSPGEKLFVDFLDNLLGYIDKDTGEIVRCSFFAASLAFSGYCFTYVCESNSTDNLIEALIACMMHLGGVPNVLTICNMNTIQKQLVDFANHYDLDLEASPRGQYLAENQVKLLCSRIFSRLRNQFYDRHSLCEAVAKMVREHNQTRMQQKQYCRQELFLAQERGALRKLPDRSSIYPCNDSHVC